MTAKRLLLSVMLTILLGCSPAFPDKCHPGYVGWYDGHWCIVTVFDGSTLYVTRIDQKAGGDIEHFQDCLIRTDEWRAGVEHSHIRWMVLDAEQLHHDCEEK